MPSELSRTILSNLGSACLQGGLLILAVWLICRAFKNLNPAVRQGLWWLACLKLLIAAIWIRPVTLAVLPAIKPGPHIPIGNEIAAASAAGSASSPAIHAVSVIPWIDYLVAAWLLGAIAVTAVSIKGALDARRIARDAQPIDDTPPGQELRGLAAEIGLSAVPRLAKSADVSAPCVVGHWRPVVIVPLDFEQTLTEEEQRMAIAHELAHVRRADLWMAIVPSCAYALFYFFPPVWIACREWATDREAACDRDALIATGARPQLYGEMLLKIAKRDHRRLIHGLGATRQFHTLKRRMAAMIAGPVPAIPRAVSFALLGVTALVIAPITLASPQSGKDILTNAGFEDGKDFPDGWTAINPGQGFELVWDSNVAHTGTHSVRITRTTSRFWPIAKWQHEVPYDGKAQSIEFGAWIKAEHAAKAVLDVQFEGPNHFWRHQWLAYIGEQNPGQGFANHDWAPYAGAAHIPEGTKTIKVSLQGYGPGTVWMDDAFVEFFPPDKR